jgi:hypothetical protein
MIGYMSKMLGSIISLHIRHCCVLGKGWSQNMVNDPPKLTECDFLYAS